MPAQTIARARLFGQLRAGRGLKLSLVACPAGFGKSTLLAAWREEEARERPVAWVTLDEGDNDAVLLTHDHHDDNLDAAGRALLPAAGVVVTTVAGAKRLGGETRGLENWATTRLEAPGRVPIEITATPCRHGPPHSYPIVGDVIGFALRWEGQKHGVLWISGDTVLYDGVRQVASRLRVGTALLHLGGVQFPISGPVRYTMTAEDAVELCASVKPRTIIPIHYEGWKHFRQGRNAIERIFEAAPEEFRSHVRWLPIGVSIDIGG